MGKRILRIILAIHAIGVGLYPSVYFIIGRKYGILQSKSAAILTNVFWNIEFYTHITLGGIALLIGWTQFSLKMRTTKLKLHRQVGKVYVVAALFSSMAGIYIALFAQGGWVASLGFICLGVIWFYTTLRAYTDIRQVKIEDHQKMMIYSYAACFSAVTLRMWLYPLALLLHDFIKAYVLVAWLCWVPNMIVAYFLVKRIPKQNNAIAALA